MGNALGTSDADRALDTPDCNIPLLQGTCQCRGGVGGKEGASRWGRWRAPRSGEDNLGVDVGCGQHSCSAHAQE